MSEPAGFASSCMAPGYCFDFSLQVTSQRSGNRLICNELQLTELTWILEIYWTVIDWH